MSVSSRRLAQVWGMTSGTDSARAVVQALLVESLSKDECKVYRAMYTWKPIGVTSMTVAATHGMSIKWASMILNKLWRYGLVKRESVIDDTGKFYVYEVVK